MLEELKQFNTEQLNDAQIDVLNQLATKARCDIVSMITRAGSGHVGGSLSSIDMYLMLWLCANISPDMTNAPNRDRIVVSHGHTSAGVYSALGNLGYFDVNEAIASFRSEGSIYEGHPSLKVKGVEWCSGSLGQGLSVGCGFALSAKLTGLNNHVYVVMGDGEQGKGQLQEAREFAAKFKLGNLTAIVDYNQLQASGKLSDIMPQNIKDKYATAGWRVLEIDGHDYRAIYKALKASSNDEGIPTLILANTIMGKGISFIENNFEYHGKVFNKQQTEQALSELQQNLKDIDGICNKLDLCEHSYVQPIEHQVNAGKPIVYPKDSMVDCRSAFGDALVSIADANADNTDITIAAFDCDLAESVKLQKLGIKYPKSL